MDGTKSLQFTPSNKSYPISNSLAVYGISYNRKEIKILRKTSLLYRAVERGCKKTSKVQILRFLKSFLEKP